MTFKIHVNSRCKVYAWVIVINNAKLKLRDVNCNFTDLLILVQKQRILTQVSIKTFITSYLLHFLQLCNSLLSSLRCNTDQRYYILAARQR